MTNESHTRDYSDHDHIPTATVVKDLSDTRREMKWFELELRSIVHDRVANKCQIYLVEGKLESRAFFCEKLIAILEYREQ